MPGEEPLPIDFFDALTVAFRNHELEVKDSPMAHSDRTMAAQDVPKRRLPALFESVHRGRSMTTPGLSESTRTELVELVAKDHARATEFISRLLTLRSSLLPIAASLSTAALAVGVAADRPKVLFGTALVILVLLLVDLTYATHYRTLRSQTRRLEQVLNASFKHAYRTNAKAHSQQVLDRALARVEIGQTSVLHRPRLRDFPRAFDLRTAALSVFIPILVGTALMTPTHSDKPDRGCILGDSGTIVMVDHVPRPVSGEVKVVPCPNQDTSHNP